MAIKFAKGKDLKTIGLIVDRAITLMEKDRLNIDRLSLHMDISAVHATDCPLKLKELLKADNFTFVHDVFGIRRHINRKTGKLKDCFLPRFAERRTRDYADR